MGSEGHWYRKWHRVRNVPRNKEFALSEWKVSSALWRFLVNDALSQTGSGSSSGFVRYEHHSSVTWQMKPSLDLNSLQFPSSLGCRSKLKSFLLLLSLPDEEGVFVFIAITSNFCSKNSTTCCWCSRVPIWCTEILTCGLYFLFVISMVSLLVGTKESRRFTSHPKSSDCNFCLLFSIRCLIASSMFLSFRTTSSASCFCLSLQITTNLPPGRRDARPLVWTSARNVAAPSNRMTKLHSGTSRPSSRTLVLISSFIWPVLKHSNSTSCSSTQAIPS